MAGPGQSSGARALDLRQTLPHVSLADLKLTPGSRKPERRPRGRRRGRKCGRGHKGERQRGTWPRLGFEGGQTPFYIQIPKYMFNEGHSFRRHYQPLNLNKLQYLIFGMNVQLDGIDGTPAQSGLEQMQILETFVFL
ncbi:hypothetical protein MC885_006741 [Smutsia gigantea]|nr:hypothetical protein MC885_006741 [Smutsia gigantea]